LSTQPGEWVLDPFAGSLTTMRAAEQLGRNSVGVDLYAPSASKLAI
jgi:site-specific DNA-methyltransferase (adenine-specific)